MKVAHSKIISAVCSVLLFATALFLLILLFTDGFSNAMNSNGSNVGESIGKACTGAVVVVSSVFAVIAQVYGENIKFNFTQKDVRELLENVTEYTQVEKNRVERIVCAQMNKYGYLFK